MERFVFGLAIFVTVSQLPKLFGLKKGSGDTIRQFAHVLDNLGATSVTTLAVGVLAVAALFALERFIPRIPGGLVVLVVAIAVSAGANLSDHGVDTVGKIPSGLPSVVTEHLTASELWVLLPSAVGMMLVIFSEALCAGETFAEKHGYRLDSSQEMIALGLANIGSGFLGGLACGGSLSQTAVNDGAGARSEFSPVVAAVLSLVTVLVLTLLFKDLPEAVLAALIIHAVFRLMKVKEMRRFYQLAPREFWLGMATLLGVITIDVLPGLIIGVVLSILLVVYRISKLPVSVLDEVPKVPGTYLDVSRHPEAKEVPRVLFVRPDGMVFYANAESVQDTVESLASSPSRPVETVLIDLDVNDELGITSAERLEKLVDALREQGLRVGLVHVHQPAIDMASRTGLLEKVGTDHILPTLASGVACARSGTAASVTNEEVG
jgi:sulfate permease, SulP family